MGNNYNYGTIQKHSTSFKIGSKEDHINYIGFPGEISIVVDDWSLRIHDGCEPGGHRQCFIEDEVEDYLNDPFIKDTYLKYNEIKKELLLRLRLRKDIDSDN